MIRHVNYCKSKNILKQKIERQRKHRSQKERNRFQRTCCVRRVGGVRAAVWSNCPLERSQWIPVDPSGSQKHLCDLLDLQKPIGKDVTGGPQLLILQLASSQRAVWRNPYNVYREFLGGPVLDLLLRRTQDPKSLSVNSFRNPNANTRKHQGHQPCCPKHLSDKTATFSQCAVHSFEHSPPCRYWRDAPFY